MRVYISGPMTGYENYNRSSFRKAADMLRSFGHEPLNPAELDLGPDATWQDYMREDIRLLTHADAIYLLNGWEKSKGATFEKLIADMLEIEIYTSELGGQG